MPYEPVSYEVFRKFDFPRIKDLLYADLVDEFYDLLDRYDELAWEYEIEDQVDVEMYTGPLDIIYKQRKDD